MFSRCIGNTVLGLMLVMALVLLIPGLFGIRPYVVYSGSMEPEIPTGAVVFTKEGEFFPKKGDIITFHNGDTVVTHRVVKKEKDIFITKGDASKDRRSCSSRGVTDHRAGSLSPALSGLRDPFSESPDPFCRSLHSGMSVSTL